VLETCEQFQDTPPYCWNWDSNQMRNYFFMPSGLIAVSDTSKAALVVGLSGTDWWQWDAEPT
jgi:hypothetical protein